MGADWNSLVGIVSLIIILAIISVIVSQKSQSATVVSSFSTALDKLLSRATSQAT